jgi:Chaperone of endosialidase
MVTATRQPVLGRFFTTATATRTRLLDGKRFFETRGGHLNTAYGSQTLYNNTIGTENVAIGYAALNSNTTGSQNTANGAGALQYDTEGSNNTGTGFLALQFNTTGIQNTATGVLALTNNISGFFNTATGEGALFNNTTGYNNTADGEESLLFNSTGSGNTALGVGAGNNVTTANNVTCIGHNVAGRNVGNTTWIGNIYGVTTQNGTTAPVIVSIDGQLGTVASSERFKKDITTMEKSSEAILSLRPVTFHYKTDTEGTPQFGLIAEEVAKVNPALVLPDKEGKPYTVRYDAVNAMLLNEFLKEHRAFVEEQRKVEKLEATVAQQHKDFEAAVAELKGQIQKVSAQLEVSKSAPQTVLINQ